MGAADAEESAAVRIGVDVDHAVLAKLVAVLFRPFGRAKESFLFAVPCGVDDGAPRTPAASGQLADGARFFEHGHLTADRIRRAVHPGVVMIAAHDPLIGAIAARQAGDDVACRHELPIECELHVYARWS